jgi:hypothetical protein
MTRAGPIEAARRSSARGPDDESFIPTGSPAPH